MIFRELDELVDAHQSVTTMVWVDGERVHTNFSKGADRPWRVYSMTKSIVSLVTGIAQDEGLINLDDHVSRYVPEWASGESSEVTIRHLLTMTSGRTWTPQLDDEMVSLADNQSVFACAVGQSGKAGGVWQYDNMAAQVLEPVLTAALGRDIEAFARERLFEPLGLSTISWERDRSHNLLTYAGITASGADVGALGQLVLNQGVANGRQLVPSAFLAEATGVGSAINPAYGFLWWINVDGYVYDGGRAVGLDHDDVPRNGRLVPGAPADTIWSLGWGSQMMTIIPSLGVVALRLGRRPRYPEDFTLEAFTNAVLAGVA